MHIFEKKSKIPQIYEQAVIFISNDEHDLEY